MVWNLPNILTGLRMLAIPLVLALFAVGRRNPQGMGDPAAGLAFAAPPPQSAYRLPDRERRRAR